VLKKYLIIIVFSGMSFLFSMDIDYSYLYDSFNTLSANALGIGGSYATSWTDLNAVKTNPAASSFIRGNADLAFTRNRRQFVNEDYYSAAVKGAWKLNEHMNIGIGSNLRYIDLPVTTVHDMDGDPLQFENEYMLLLNSSIQYHNKINIALGTNVKIIHPHTGETFTTLDVGSIIEYPLLSSHNIGRFRFLEGDLCIDIIPGVHASVLNSSEPLYKEFIYGTYISAAVAELKYDRSVLTVSYIHEIQNGDIINGTEYSLMDILTYRTGIRHVDPDQYYYKSSGWSINWGQLIRDIVHLTDIKYEDQKILKHLEFTYASGNMSKVYYDHEPGQIDRSGQMIDFATMFWGNHTYTLAWKF
jgi:hypothetical protein